MEGGVVDAVRGYYEELVGEYERERGKGRGIGGGRGDGGTRGSITIRGIKRCSGRKYRRLRLCLDEFKLR